MTDASLGCVVGWMPSIRTARPLIWELGTVRPVCAYLVVGSDSDGVLALALLVRPCHNSFWVQQGKFEALGQLQHTHNDSLSAAPASRTPVAAFCLHVQHA
jgi:hypothetical protein